MKLRNSSILILAGLCAAPVLAENPYTEANGTWINLSGTVETVTRNAFTLDYGDGIVTVEMDDGDRDADAYKLVSGDEVTVSGMVDDDFFESTSIEASSVYVENIGTTFFSSAMDEEDSLYIAAPLAEYSTLVQGRVTDVEDGQFTLDTGLRKIDVSVDELGYNPLDDSGYQKVEVGDRVSVSGDIDLGLFERQEMDAKSLVELAS